MAFAMPRARSHHNNNITQDYRVPKPLVLRHAPASANYLLLKSPIGKARPPIYDLPGPDFVYGRKIENSEVSATLTAKGHAHVSAAERPAYDYVSMNRASAKEGIITAKATREFRRTHPSCIKRGDRAGAANRKDHSKRGWLPSDKNPAYVYGKPSAESTPVAALLTDVFTQNWLEEQRIKMEERAQKEKEKHRKPKMMNKMLQSRIPPKKKAVVEIAPHELFKIKRFTAVDHRVETHWNADPDNAYRKMVAEHKAAQDQGKDKTKNQVQQKQEDANTSAVAQQVQKLSIGNSVSAGNKDAAHIEKKEAKGVDEASIYRQRPAGKVNPVSVNINILSWD